jgi:hypothetical protein
MVGAGFSALRFPIWFNCRIQEIIAQPSVIFVWIDKGQIDSMTEKSFSNLMGRTYV